MHGFIQKIQQRIHDDQLIEAEHHVVAAVSGGADSVAMAMALSALGVNLSLAYVDHGTRPETAAWGEGVRALADSLGCDFHGLTCDPGSGSEADLRKGRYGALESLDADRIATAHTADDQAETVLMRLLRGAGTAGLAGIPPRRGRIVRPLLGVTREDVMDYLNQSGQSFVEDPSNQNTDPLRNRVRHTLLPLLRIEFQSNVVKLLSATADTLRIERELLEQLAAGHLAEHGLLLAALRSTHPAIRAHVVRAACPVSISSERYLAIERLMCARGGAVQLEGGCTVEIPKGSKLLVFSTTKSSPCSGTS